MWHVGIWHEACALAGNIVYTRNRVRGLGSGVECSGCEQFFEMGVYPLGSTGIDFALWSLMRRRGTCDFYRLMVWGLGVWGLFDVLGLFVLLSLLS
jgi:hypothetical protein